MPLPCLPVLSASSCSSQAPTSAMPGRRDDRHLVAPGIGRRRRGSGRAARPGWRPAACRPRRSAPSARSTSGTASMSMPHRRRRHHAEIRQHRIAAADRRVAEEDVRGSRRASATCPHLRARIGHRDEVLARPCRRPPASSRSKKYALKMFGSSVLPDLLTDDAQRLGEIDLGARAPRSAPDRCCRGHAASGKPALLAERLRQHLRPEAGAAHAEQQRRAVKPLGLHLVLECCERRQVGDAGHRRSAASRATWPRPSPVHTIGVARPQRARSLPSLAPILERRLDRLRPARPASLAEHRAILSPSIATRLAATAPSSLSAARRTA